jgi:hypothetical protein
VTVRQLINHLSLLGALANIGAADDMHRTVRGLLAAQESANTFAFGSYAATLSCIFQHLQQLAVY